MIFNKEPDGKWYVDLPDWEGSHSDLEMVSGADIMLDMLSSYTNSVELKIATNPLLLTEQFLTLSFVEMADDIGNGAYYHFNNQLTIDETNVDMKIWLCDVLKFVFNCFPPKIYFHIIK